MKQIAMAVLVLLSLSACHSHSANDGHDHNLDEQGTHTDGTNKGFFADSTQESFSVAPDSASAPYLKQ